MNNRRIPAASESGFVLASTLWVVAALLIMVAGFETYIASALERSHRLGERLQSSVDVLSTEQTLRYLLSTHRQTLGGLDWQHDDLSNIRNEDGLISLSAVGGELRFDGRVYQGIGRVLFSIQDESGLIPLNTASPFALESYLQVNGIPDAEIARYRDRLRDYWDVDDLRHLNGAEKTSYLRAAMAPPRNDYLRTHTELTRVMGWRELSNGTDKTGAMRVFSVNRASRVNLNTMPVALLGAFAQDPESIIERREQEPFRSSNAVKAQIPALNSWPEEGFRFFASSRFRLELWVEGSIQSQIIGLELSPLNLRGPVREHYRFESYAPLRPGLTGADSQTIFQQFNALPSQ